MRNNHIQKPRVSLLRELLSNKNHSKSTLNNRYNKHRSHMTVYNQHAHHAQRVIVINIIVYKKLCNLIKILSIRL